MYVKKMPLTFEQVNEWIAYDETTGIFTWKKSPARRIKAGAEAGGAPKSARRSVKTGQVRGYRYINVLHYQTPAARVAWLLTYGKWPDGDKNLLFKDGDPTNLRIANLKEGEFPAIKSMRDGRRVYKMTSEAMRHYGLKHNYGISPEVYKLMLDAQNGVCAICKQPETGKSSWGGIRELSVDHNHETNEVRGLLCTQCNYMIGHCRENREFLLEGVKYLDKHAGRESTVTLTVVPTEEPKHV